MPVQEDHVHSIFYGTLWGLLLEISGAGHPYIHQQFQDAVTEALEGAASVLEYLQVIWRHTFFSSEMMTWTADA